MKVVSALVFLAMAAYLGFYLVERMIDPVQTALVVTATMSDSAPMSGLVVRDEVVLQGDAPYIDVIAEDGERIAFGQTVALVYDSEDALLRAEELADTEQEIESVRAALSGARTVTSGDRDSSILDAMVGLSASLRSDGLRSLDTRQSTLASLLFRREVSDATEDYLAALEAERSDLLRGAAGERTPILASQSGTYASIVDGFEGVDPAYVEDLGPAELREIIAAERTEDPAAIGKLVLSFNWYYAAILDREDAGRLEEGQRVRLSFGRYTSGALSARVAKLGRIEGDERLVLFRMDRGLTEMLAVRAVAAELIYSEYTGLRVPLDGLYRYYAGYVSEEDAAWLSEGQTVTLTLGDESVEALVSDLSNPRRYGELPAGVEADSDLDTRPKRSLAVFAWRWDAGADAPDFSSGGGTVLADEGRRTLPVVNYYDYDPEIDRLCVFTMTGLQAERKKVELVFAGEEYCLLSSEGDDALREGNEVIVQASGLYNGRVFRG